MTEKVRRAPFPEWVQMYRQGIPAKKIAGLVHAPYSTVRYHLARAAELEPDLRATHASMARPVPKVTAAGRRNLETILTLYAATGKLPTAGAGNLEERALGSWLQDRRRQAAEGTLSPYYADGLAKIPDWTQHTSKKDRDESRWNTRFAELVTYLAAGNDWPRHQKTSDHAEQRLGLWLHSQRISKRASTLSPDKKARLDTEMPGWQAGRPRTGRRPAHKDQQPTPGPD
ncbi:helicase associated domain-containing protein [Arthrobacter sp. ZBG10]|uniref:helicase associated domain-containing protein n=1 Tax=Arthrobacter sp. ZBG10 TaxID=1676590 RepID=UPI001E394AA1|nr:helicase associated domain-containing protein [Arthrobacter sp. ZBG10]